MKDTDSFKIMVRLVFEIAFEKLGKIWFVCLFVCLCGRQGEADRLNCNPLQRVGIPFFRDLASRPRTLLLLLPSMVLRGGDEENQTPGKTSSKKKSY